VGTFLRHSVDMDFLRRYISKTGRDGAWVATNHYEIIYGLLTCAEVDDDDL